MIFVLDSSVAAKWVLPEIDTDKALRVRNAYQHGTHDLLAPDFFPYEVANVFTKAERQKKLTPPSGWAGWRTVMADAPRLIYPAHLMPRAYSISSQYGSAIFDCLYVALAEEEHCQFLTADQRVVANLQDHFPFVRALSSMP
ncbi:MAG TPA: type II toxin-antitoxin system VapC family toxin [Gemmataceae bacterium]|jgi:predicted nucleic acid-binding protein|nr:type II toxin-antitoxin system VapC family toxin [Gemmataceae bacterium]